MNADPWRTTNTLTSQRLSAYRAQARERRDRCIVCDAGPWKYGCPACGRCQPAEHTRNIPANRQEGDAE